MGSLKELKEPGIALAVAVGLGWLMQSAVPTVRGTGMMVLGAAMAGTLAILLMNAIPGGIQMKSKSIWGYLINGATIGLLVASGSMLWAWMMTGL